MLKKTKQYIFIPITILIISLSVAACSNEREVDADDLGEKEEIREEVAEASEDPHSNDMEPNYDVVFNENEVMEFNIVIDSEDWELMQEDLYSNVSGGKNSGGYEPIWVESSITVDGIT